jgi:hypothetical protein
MNCGVGANLCAQIKNTVKTSQSIALSEKAVFSMEHVKRVLEVAEAFEDDMRGGKGYRDAMRHYTWAAVQRERTT